MNLSGDEEEKTLQISVTCPELARGELVYPEFVEGVEPVEGIRV
jgi:hypothetical protein